MRAACALSAPCNSLWSLVIFMMKLLRGTYSHKSSCALTAARVPWKMHPAFAHGRIAAAESRSRRKSDSTETTGLRHIGHAVHLEMQVRQWRAPQQLTWTASTARSKQIQHANSSLSSHILLGTESGQDGARRFPLDIMCQRGCYWYIQNAFLGLNTTVLQVAARIQKPGVAAQVIEDAPLRADCVWRIPHIHGLMAPSSRQKWSEAKFK
jgi:hypothetical protein